MTISSTARKAGPYVGNSVATSFAFAFKVFAATDLQVVKLTAATGVQSTLVLNTDYSVALNADQNASPGGTVTYPLSGSPLASPDTITIAGNIDALQGVSLLTAGGFYPSVIENAFDRAVILIQQLFDKIGRGLRGPVSDSQSLNMELPPAITRASKALGFDSLGQPIAISSSTAVTDSSGVTVPDGGNLTAFLFGKNNRVVDSIAALKALDKTKYTRAFVTGYYSAGDGGGGEYWYDATDIASSDNGGTLIVAADGARWKLRFAGSYSLRQFGAKIDGGTDDTTAVQAALNAAPKGTCLILDGRCRIGSITIPAFISVSGSGRVFGMTDTYDSTTFSTMGTTFLVNAGATITMRNGSTLENLHVLPYGLSFPQNNPSSYAGTAITIYNGVGINTVDVFLRNLLIVGFNQCVSATNAPRLICENVNFDGVNGISVTTAGDPIRYFNCHGWPFGTIAGAIITDAGARDRRAGVAFAFATNCDAGKLINCFAFGYGTGFSISAVNGLTFVNCGSDDYNLITPLTSIGWNINGTCPLTILIGCQSVAHNYGIAINATDDTNVLQIMGGLIGSNASDNIHQVLGTVNVSGVTFGSAQRAVGCYGATNRLLFNNNVLQGLTSEVILNNAASPYVFIGPNCCRDISVPMYNGSAVEISIASAAAVALPMDCDNILVTGTTNIFGFTGGWPGRVVHLRFAGVLTLSDAAGMQMAGNFTTAANATLSLRFTSAGQCYEVSRSTN